MGAEGWDRSCSCWDCDKEIAGTSLGHRWDIVLPHPAQAESSLKPWAQLLPAHPRSFALWRSPKTFTQRDEPKRNPKKNPKKNQRQRGQSTGDGASLNLSASSAWACVEVLQYFGVIWCFSLFRGDVSPIPGCLGRLRDKSQDGNHSLRNSPGDTSRGWMARGCSLMCYQEKKNPHKIQFPPSPLPEEPRRRIQPV